MGNADQARVDLDDALAICTRTGEVVQMSDLHRRRGELRRPDSSASESEFQRALTIAREQGAKLFELRAAVNLAQLWRDQGDQRKLASC